MFYLIYVSRAIPGLTCGDLRDILRASREKNGAAGITGLLFFKEGRFMQLLEGEEATVRALVERIVRDPRHRDVLTLQEGHMGYRLFPGWAMAFRRLDPAPREPVEADHTLEAAEIEFTEKALRAHSSRALTLLYIFKEYV